MTSKDKSVAYVRTFQDSLQRMGAHYTVNEPINERNTV